MDVAKKTEIHLETPPLYEEVIQTSTLEEDAHYLRTTLDKAENMLVAAGIRLTEMLKTKFEGNLRPLRNWYISAVEQGKEHRKWQHVVRFVLKEPHKFQTREEIAAEVIKLHTAKINSNKNYRKNIKDEIEAARTRVRDEQNQGLTENSTSSYRGIREPFKPVNHQLEDLVLSYLDLSRRDQDEFLHRINAQRIVQ